jgi:hypothetical protein
VARNLTRERNVRKATAAALLLFTLLSLAFTWPLPLHLDHAVEDRQDALLNVWITAWDGHQLLSDPVHLFDANIFHPYPRTLAYSELLLGNGLLALPLTAATGNPVLGYNLALLLSFVLSGFGTYLLVLKWTRSPGAGLVAGVIFAFSAYRMTNLAQAQLLTTQWLPLALLSLHQLLRRPRPRHVATTVLFVCFQALSSFYYAILLALAVVGYAAFELIAQIRASGLGLRAWLVGHRSWLAYLLLAAGCCALIVLPFALPYSQVQRELGFQRSLADNEPFSASLRQYLMVPPGSVVHGRWLPSDDTPIAGGYPVDALFPGLLTMALALWGLIRGRGRARWFALLLVLISFLLSLGPRLYLAPGQPAGLDVALPYAWLYALVPGFKALRAPVRFDALLMLGLAVLAGYGVAALLDGKGCRFAQALLVGCLLLLGVESLVWPAAVAEPVPVGVQVPPVYRWLAEQDTTHGPHPGPVLELPMAFTPGGPRLDYQYLSTYHWRTTPDGYSGFIPPKHGQIVYEMERFPSERSLSLLQALDVAYVVVHADRYPAERRMVTESTAAWAADLAWVESFGADEVYSVRSRSFDPGGLVVRGYLPPQASAGQPYTAYLVVTNPGPRSYAVAPTERVRASAVWEAAGGWLEERVEADLPLVTSPEGGAAVVPLHLATPPAPGAYRLVLEEQGGPLGDWRVEGGIEVDGPDAAPGAAAFPVPARLVAWHIPATAAPGEALPVALTWRALGKIDAYYSVYVKLLDAGGNAIAGWDGQPQDGAAPTLLWVPGEVVEDTVILAIPANTPPGDYTVEVGMYRAEDLARCLTLDREGVPLDRVVLGTVHIGP